MKTHFSHRGEGGLSSVTVEPVGDGKYQVQVGDASLRLDVRRVGPGEYHVLCGTDGHDVVVVPPANGHAGQVLWDGTAIEVALLDEQQAARAALVTGTRAGSRGADGAVAIRAPMPGKVVKRLVEAGQTITAGQGLIVIEAMKMENELRSPVDGLVKELRVGEGDAVEAGEPLVLVE